MKLRLILLLCLLHQALGKVSYEGYKVYSVTPHNGVQRDILHSIETNPKYDFWRSARKLNVPATVMVAPNHQAEFEKTMEENHITMSVFIDNVQNTVKPIRSKTSNVTPGNVTFDEYMTHDEMNAYLKSIAEKYPDFTTLEIYGKSFEERELIGLRISTGSANSTKPTILIDAGIHGREWISSPVALYIINQLVENSTVNYDMFKDVDWLILPMLNPDGYTYSQNEDDYWRKTRSTTADPDCPGVDANRNFDYHWMETGASDDPCSIVYAGPKALSEPEVLAFSNLMLSHNDSIKLYLSIQSYGSFMLYPWGYDYIAAPNEEELYELGIAAVYAIEEYAPPTDITAYEVGNSAMTLYPAAGASDDYTMGVGGVDLCYTIELPYGGGDNGFAPPEESIRPIVEETFVGIKIFQGYVQNKYVA